MKRIDSPHFRGLPQRRLLGTLLALALGAASASALAMSDGNYRIDASLLGGGGGAMSDGGFVLVGGLGEAILGAAGDGSQQLAAGFMAGASAVAGGASNAGSSPAPATSSGSATPPVPTLISAPAHVETTLSGATPVTAAAGSTLVIPVGSQVAGTPISLAAPAAGQAADPVTIKIGGQTLTVTPTGSGSVVILKKVIIDGVETPVLSVTSGSVTVSGAAGQPLLALGNGGVVSAGDSGGTVSTGTGNSLAVTAGYIVLPANAFAASHGFASIEDGKLYAGEVADLDAAGKVTSVRLGSLTKDGSALGDPLQPASAAHLEDRAVVPNLKGKVARLSAERDYIDLLAASMGQGVAAQGQNSDGVLHLTLPGATLHALPVGSLTVDTSRADGVTLTANGQAEIVRGGVIATFAPSVADLARFAAQLAQLDPDAVLSIQADGRVQLRLNRTIYALQPAWTASPDSAEGSFGTDEQGHVVYRDGATRQTLYPVFADQPQLGAALQALDPVATLAAKGDGSYTIEVLGQGYTLKPDYRLSPAPAEQGDKAWWQDPAGSKLYLRNGDGSAQGFTVK